MYNTHKKGETLYATVTVNYTIWLHSIEEENVGYYI